MRSTEDDFDIRIGFSFIDHCLQYIDPPALFVYLVLRRYIWRKATGDLGAFYRDGLLCCSIRQKRISELTAIHRNTIIRHMEKLRDLGWIETKKIGERDELVYSLGERVKTASGKYEGEIFYSDSWVETKVAEAIRGREGCNKNGQGVPKNGAGGAPKSGTGCPEIGQGVPQKVAGEVDNREVENQNREYEIASQSSTAQNTDNGGGGKTGDGVRATTPPPQTAEPPRPVGVQSSCGGVAGVISPGRGNPDTPVKKEKGPRTRPLYDPNKPVTEWNAPNVAGYFLHKHREAFIGQPDPELHKGVLAQIKARLDWMAANNLTPELMKQTVDYIFGHWNNGLPKSLKFDDHYPSFTLICHSGFFKRIMDKARYGDKKTTFVSEWDPESAKGMPVVGWGDTFDDPTGEAGK